MHVLIALLISLLLSLPVIASGQSLNERYILVDLTHPAWPALKTVFNTRHQSIRPGNVLSITLSDDGTRAVVKIIGATSQWQVNNGIIRHPAILENHPDNSWAVDLWRTDPAWSQQTADIP